MRQSCRSDHQIDGAGTPRLATNGIDRSVDPTEGPGAGRLEREGFEIRLYVLKLLLAPRSRDVIGCRVRSGRQLRKRQRGDRDLGG